jgi:hypothetical protein
MKQYYTVATKRSPMGAGDDSTPNCPMSAYCSLWPLFTSLKSLSLAKSMTWLSLTFM